jgi:hypothetical protein
MNDPSTKPTILPDEEAKAILEKAIVEKLGPNWNADDSGWTIISSHAYMARLNKGRTNVDFYVDYFTGEVSTEVKTVNEGQDVGRLIGWVLFGLFAAAVIVLARGLGWI